MALNSEKTLAAVLRIVDMMTEEQRGTYDYMKKHEGDPYAVELDKSCWGMGGELYDLEQRLREDIAATAAKAGGYGDIRKAMQKVIKNVPDVRRYTAGIFPSEKGGCFVCDGFVLIRSDKVIHGLPDADTERFSAYKKVEHNDVTVPAAEYTEQLPIPTLGEVKAYIKTKDAEIKAAGKKPKDNPYPLDLGDGLPALNPHYLVTMLEGLGSGCRAYWSGDLIKPIYFRNDDGGDGIIMPVRKKAVKASA